ncbi:MAG: hypothetical protein AAFU79_27910, partial [Myxococcota bacterium]
MIASATVADGVFRLELAPLRRPISWSLLGPAAGLLVVLGGVLGALTLGPRLFSGPGASGIGAVMGTALGAALVVVAWPRLRPPSRLDPIFIEGRRIIFPRSAWREGEDAAKPPRRAPLRGQCPSPRRSLRPRDR